MNRAAGFGSYPASWASSAAWVAYRAMIVLHSVPVHLCSWKVAIKGNRMDPVTCDASSMVTIFLLLTSY